MASEKTPNLALNQIDRSSPKTTYFDLEKYLDENWRAVDDFAGNVNEGVNAIKKRLDTTETKSVTLSPGVQVLNAEKAAPFSLTGLSGRTLVNLAGRDWGANKNIARFSSYQATLSLDSSKTVIGGGSLKIISTVANGNAQGVGLINITAKAGKKYLAAGYLYNESGSSVQLAIQSTALQSTATTTKNGWVFHYIAFTYASDVPNVYPVARVNTTAVGQVGYADGLRLYEVSDAEYAALASMTPEQVAAKYPYVDSVMPVRNPYSIRYGENLLPSFYEWSRIHANAKVTGPYSMSHVKTGANTAESSSSPFIPVLPNTNYYLKNDSSDATLRVYFSLDGITAPTQGSLDISDGTFKTTADCKYILVESYIAAEKAGTFNYNNPMLSIGSTAKPFKPREDAMLALQTDLYADPVTGANADTVFERDGQYFKILNWKRLTLDGSLPWEINTSTSGTGYKAVQLFRYQGLMGISSNRNALVSKYDGKVLDNKGSSVGGGADQHNGGYAPDYGILLTVSSADSGWGDSYTPTADEVKAYFMGWKMKQYQSEHTVPYTSGTKEWVQVLTPVGTNTTTLPTTQAPNWTPSQLLYQLAKPTVEPIVSEGQLTFAEGDNQVEVGTGIVLRENVKPVGDSSTDPYVQINRIDYGSKTKYRVNKFLQVYRDSQKDTKWGSIQFQDGQTYGLERLSKPRSEFSPSEAYSVTYLMLDKSPIAAFVGTYAANEKTLLLDLVDSVQQNTARVSVLENKKAEKDTPAWIAATLLNAWVPFGGANARPEYAKFSDGIVIVKGVIKGGVVATDTTLMVLPKGYRPKDRLIFPVYSNGKIGFVWVASTGEVGLDIAVIDNTSLAFNLIFQAEQ
jgi:hypothetical protein